MEAQTDSTSNLIRRPKAVSTKTDSQVANGVGFGRSLYGWKDNFKELPLELVWVPNSLGVDGNIWNKWTSRVCQFAATPSFGLLARVSCWGPWWTWLGGYAHPNTHIISSRHHIRVLFEFSFSWRNWIVHCNCVDWSFYSDPGPSFLISSTVSISPLASSSWTPTLPSLHTHLQFQIAFIPSCLCSSIRLLEKPSWWGQSSWFWLITNRAVV